jgi:uncharacterized membrane protein YphA (DoxX/SURF4 family)
MREQREIDVRHPSPDAGAAVPQHDGDGAGGVRILRETVPTRMQPQETERDQVLREPVRMSASWPLGSAVRIAFGLIWAIDAWFKWQPEFQQNFMKIVQGGATGQPPRLGPFYRFWVTVLQPYAHALAVGAAIGETVIAGALILGLGRKYLYVLGALWSFGIWAIPEGFGNTSRAAYTDIGTSVVYVLVFAALWAIDSCAGRSRYSLDAVIERHLPWWRRVAEAGR